MKELVVNRPMEIVPCVEKREEASKLERKEERNSDSINIYVMRITEERKEN